VRKEKRDLCATVFYRKLIRGKLYPKAARTGPYAFAQEVKRVNGKVVTRYIGIMKVLARDAAVIENSGGADGTDVIEKGGEANADQFDESE